MRLRDLIRKICRTHEIEILQRSVSRDHVHVLLSCPPNVSPSKVIQYIKGKCSRKRLMELGHLQKQYWGRHLWACGYFVASSGNVTDEVIMDYICEQDCVEPGDSGDTSPVKDSCVHPWHRAHVQQNVGFTDAREFNGIRMRTSG